MAARNSPELSDREQHLLRALVERYIHDGQPVGSRYLSREAGLSLSPATIRNVMADLEEMGLIRSPHTSAGRVPTATGYRFFINALLKARPLRAEFLDILRSDLVVPDETNSELLEHASRLLARVTGMAGVVVMPKRENVTLRHIEFMQLSRDRVLVILVTNEHEVHNRIVIPARKFSAAELQEASNYLNQQFAGKALADIRNGLLANLQETREQMNQAMMDVTQMAHQALQVDHKDDSERFVVAGETNLMEFAELSNVERLHKLFDAFSQGRDLIHLLDQCMKADGVQIFIGEESGYHVLDGLSVVTAPYGGGDHAVVGVLGVIGPTRMEYEKVIAVVDITAKLLGSVLNSHGTPPI